MIQIYNGIKLGKPDTAIFDYKNGHTNDTRIFTDIS